MELSDAGIRFKKSRSASLNDISFTGGVLSLPPIVVDDTTESTFLELIAFERFHVNFAGSEVTSYIFFMSKIIESAEDVSLLRARGIIENALGSDNDVSILFNSLSKDVTLDQDTRLYGLHGEVNRYWKERTSGIRHYIVSRSGQELEFSMIQLAVGTTPEAPPPFLLYIVVTGKTVSAADDSSWYGGRWPFFNFFVKYYLIRAALLFKEAGRNEVIRYSTGGNEVIRSAMELSDAGIRFKKSRSARLDDISFTGGVLSLPPILVDNTTESTFLNLMAFERFHFDLVGDEVTSYIFFMSKIIDSAEDVRLLRAGGIIKNALGSDSDVAKLFDSLSKDVTLDPDSSLCELQGTVNLYWLKRLRRVELMQVQQNYFRNPWSIPAFIAAAFLFLFTLVQTAYAIISYHDPAKN
ncbi:hypothetical protein RHGRI_033292 [Rhododendron griersonianum]|uniref:Uncharacterized protein n=1 Tax=Rhododendron griersonianum TaxID=479676 RepID=A0AAV6HZW9_9ERIC|nr:hypothetical protein RHGRI_033292 [Rhododendron griersonianum]